MPDFEPSPAFNALWRRHFPNEQIPAERRARFKGRWLELIAEAETLKDSDPASPQALDLARRARAFVGEFTGGNPQHAAVLKTISKRGFPMRSRPPTCPIRPPYGTS